MSVYNTNVIRSKFSLGQIVHTPGAAEILSQAEMGQLLARHAQGDWGDLDSDDKARNEADLLNGERLFSSYKTARGKVYIITEWDRSCTTILLPEEY